MDPVSDEIIGKLSGLVREHGEAESEIPGLRFSTRLCSNPVFHIQESAVCFILQGRKQVTIGTENYTYSPATFFIAPVDLPMTSQISGVSPDKPYLGVSIGIDPLELATLLVETRPPFRTTGAGLSPLTATPMTGQIGDALIRLLNLCEAPDEIPVLAPLIKREIFFRLLQTPQYSALRQLSTDDGKIRRISRAIEWMKHNITEPLRIESLAKRVSMSPSSLHHQFKEVTSLSPLQFQKHLRLQKARQLVMTGETTIENIARQVGYMSPSQFSREYSRHFDISPSEENRRFRASVTDSSQTSRT